jgi:hypothetical protein
LDNAWIQFNQIELPKSALLNRYADINESGEYTSVEGVAPFAMIGQRLYTGRVAVAQAALSYTRTLFQKTRAYADNKACWSAVPGSEPMLSGIPQLRAIFQEADVALEELDQYVAQCEEELSECLKSERIPGTKLVEAIATAKVRAVEGCIDLSFRLKQEVGSFALMGDAGFAHLDFLQCCKFAEGDSRILVSLQVWFVMTPPPVSMRLVQAWHLITVSMRTPPPLTVIKCHVCVISSQMQKMARDRLKLFKRKGASDADEAEARLCVEIGMAMQKNMENGGDKQAAWDASWQEIYELAELVMDRTQTDFMANAGRD